MNLNLSLGLLLTLNYPITKFSAKVPQFILLQLLDVEVVLPNPLLPHFLRVEGLDFGVDFGVGVGLQLPT